MRTNFAAWLLLGFFVFPAVLCAQPRAVIVRTEERPAIDGILSEHIWSSAIPVTDFVQREPDNGAPATERTEFLLLYDQHYLYIGIRCYDDPSKVIGREMARDVNLGNDDRVQIILDTHLDGRNAYWFQIGPRGSIGDAIISENGAGFHREWQGVWEGRASLQPHGWEAEIAIPFNTLNFDASRKDWGIKLIRYIRRNQEAVYWPTANLNNHRFQVSDAGLLTGLENISQGMGLDINPYGISGHDYLRGTGGSGMADVGVDVFYQVTPGLRGVLTVNTDFAETEADTRQINLTRFSLHFPEKRDFFLDGGNYFNFGISSGADNPYARRLIPFFSRRIGLDSRGEPLAINAGGRFTGQAGNWNLGFMNIYQEKAYGDRNLSAMRVSRNIGKQSSAGMIATLGNATAPGDNALYGVDVKIATSEFAGDKNLSFTAYGLQSVTSTPGIARSADHAFGAEVNYPNDLFYGRTGFMQIDQDFSAGMGFVPRPGVREAYFSAGAGPRPGKWGILQVLSMGGINHISGTDGNLQTRETELTPLHIRFISGESLIARAVISHENLQHEFNLLGAIPIPAGSYDFTAYSLALGSARHRNLWSTISVSRGDFYSGERKTIGVNAGWQVFLHLFLGVEVENSFLRFPGADMDVGIYRLIINTVFTPDINLHTFVQYDDISQTAGWQSRLRWIIRPGREVFLSWNSSIHDPMDRFAINESSLRFKLKYNVRF